MARNRSWRAAVVAAGLAALLPLSGCGGFTDVEQLQDQPPGEGVKAVSADLERWKKGTSTEPDLTDEPAPAKDKDIMLISCGQAQSSCARGIQGAQDAASELGWDTTVYDTAGNYSSASNGIRQAIAQGMDGIFVYFIDCSYMQQSLQEAKAAGIPVVQAEGVDCNQADPSAPSLFTDSVSYVEGGLLEWIKDFGAASAAYAVTETNGRGDVLFIGDNAAIGTRSVYQGFDEMMARCPDCSSEIIEYSFDQLDEGISEDLQQKLLRRPDVSAIGVAYDGILMSGVFSAVRQAEKSDRKLLLTGGEGSTAAMDLTREGLVSAGPGLDNEWEGWSAMDNLNRIFHDVPTRSSGIGIEVYDQQTAPASGPFVSKIDFKSAYTRAWHDAAQ